MHAPRPRLPWKQTPGGRRGERSSEVGLFAAVGAVECIFLQQLFKNAVAKKYRRGGDQFGHLTATPPALLGSRHFRPVGRVSSFVPERTFEPTGRFAATDRTSCGPLPLTGPRKSLFSVQARWLASEPPGSLGGVTALLSQRRHYRIANGVPVDELGRNRTGNLLPFRQCPGDPRTGSGRGGDRTCNGRSTRHGSPRPRSARPPSPRSGRPARWSPAGG